MSQARAAQIRDMFATIAPRYDRANTVLSGGLHHRWRERVARMLALPADARVLDTCCGTGDLALAVARHLGADGSVVATDFCEEMLELGQGKAAQRGESRVEFRPADLLALPFEDASFDAATVGFGIRNVVEPVAGLSELARVVRPGGRIAVLEFGQPRVPVLGALYRSYSRWVIPVLGKWITGVRAPYEYLPETSARFPAGAQFVESCLKPAGLGLVQMRRLMLGIAWIYVAEVPRRAQP